MSKQKIISRGPKHYQRGKPKYPSTGKAFLIVTEGEKTEPNYFKALRERLQLKATNVVLIHPKGTDPITLVKNAIELRSERKKESKKGSGVAYDEVWIIFDLEKPHDARRKLAKEAKELKEAKGIKFGDSDPCFEFWLLLHEEFTTAQFVDCDAVIVRLKNHIPDYSKGWTPSSEYLKKLPDAIERAQRCRKHHFDTNGDGNPSTEVDKLVSNLNQATRPHLRLVKKP
ncbi:MAG: RloB family protein [Bacteroidota bacterium]